MESNRSARILISGLFMAGALLFSVGAFARVTESTAPGAPGDASHAAPAPAAPAPVAAAPAGFTYPAICTKTGALDIEIAVPCADDATRNLYNGKNIGLVFSGVGSFTMPKFDRLAPGDDDAHATCVGSFKLTDRSKIERVLKGQLTPHVTVAPGNGHWINYAGAAVGKDAPADSGIETAVDTDGESCAVGFTVGNRRATGDLHAANAECLREFDRDHVVNTDSGAFGTLASNGKATDRGTMVGACRDSVASVARLAGSSPVICAKTLKAGEQADATATDSDSMAFRCASRDNPKNESPIVLKQIADAHGAVTGNEAHAIDAGSAKLPVHDFNP